MTVYKSKSSPFVKEGFIWADKLAKDADHLAASISVASAVHAPEPPMQSASSVRRCGSSLKRRMCPPVSAAHHTMLTPWLSAHTSMLLKATLNPLEDALSEELANSDLPILFLHGVGGLPAYLEMLLQVCRTRPRAHSAMLRHCSQQLASTGVCVCACTTSCHSTPKALAIKQSMSILMTCFCCPTLQVMALGHPVIVVQCPGVSMRLGPVLPADAVVEQVVGVLDKLGVEQACVIGHSYGTHLWLQHRAFV
jgi:hypothetical protein